MSGALAAFFGCPLGGSLFALEVNSRFGIEYFEHTVEAVFCGEVCLAVFRALARLPIAPIWHLTDNKLESADSIHICYGALLGLVGAATAALFTKFHFNTLNMFQRAGLLKEENAVSRALCGAVVIAFLGLVLPATLFWGEYEFQTIATGAPATTLPHVWPKTNGFPWGEPREGETDGPLLSLLVGLGKLIAISFSVCGGYRGGFIFPLFCSGAAFGRAIHFFLPAIPLQLCVLCLAAALNVAVTRTCISTTLILAFLAGEPNAISAILAAALASLFATAYMPFIKTQVARADIESSIFILDYSAVAATMGPTTATATTGDMDDTANSDPLTPFSADGVKTGSRHPPDYGSSTTITVDV
jgi:H+/Cl- antiporter ClcA